MLSLQKIGRKGIKQFQIYGPKYRTWRDNNTSCFALIIVFPKHIQYLYFDFLGTRTYKLTKFSKLSLYYYMFQFSKNQTYKATSKCKLY